MSIGTDLFNQLDKDTSINIADKTACPGLYSESLTPMMLLNNTQTIFKHALVSCQEYFVIYRLCKLDFRCFIYCLDIFSALNTSWVPREFGILDPLSLVFF